MSHQNQFLLLTEVYDRYNTTPYNDPRHPNQTTVGRHVVSFNGDVRLLNEPDVFEAIRPIFQKAAQNMETHDYHPTFSTYVREACTTESPVAYSGPNAQKADIHGLASRISAVFSDKKAADEFLRLLEERMSTGRLGTLNVARKSYNVCPRNVSSHERNKARHLAA